MRSITRSKLGYDLRQGRKELKEREASRVERVNALASSPASTPSMSLPPSPLVIDIEKPTFHNGYFRRTPNAIRRENFKSLLGSIQSGTFTGDTITAMAINNDELIELIAAIRVKPGLAETIKYLYLSNYDVSEQRVITGIPKLRGFTGLKVFSIAGNKLRAIPEGLFDDCPLLEEAHFNRNNIMLVPEKLFQNCKALKVFNIHGNDLTALPDALFDGCELLSKLYVCNNKLSEISDKLLKGCKELKILDLSNNQLKTLPELLLKSCVALEILHLEHNEITNLSAKLLHECVNLQSLLLNKNKLTEIPVDFLTNCKKITKFTHDDIPGATKPSLPPAKSNGAVNLSDRRYNRDPLYFGPPKIVLAPPKQSVSSTRPTPPRRPMPRPSDATVTITAAEHAELMKNKTKTDELAQTVASQAAALEEIKLQLRDLNKVQAPVVDKPQFTQEEKATFVKTDALELKLADKLQDSRAATVNVLLEQSNVLPQDSAQNQAMINKLQELIWGMRKAEERAANAEQIALMAIAELRDFQEQTQQSLDFISKNMTENEAFLYEAIVRINKLGSAFTVLSAEMGKNNQYATVCNALNEGKHQGAATFMISFVSKFTTEETFSKLAVGRKFKFDYGTYGMISDTLVAIANLVSITGVGSGATLVQTAVRGFEDRKKVAKAKKIVNVSGRIVGGAEELATRIVVSILQLNGHLIAHCADDVANAMAKMCFDAAIKYIAAAPKDQAELSAEEIAYAIMSGKCLDPKSSYSGFILSFDPAGCLLASRAQPNNHAKPREWLSDTLMQYGNNPERLDNMLATPPRSASFSRKPSMTTKFDAFKADMQKRAAHPEEASSQFKNRFVAN